MRRESKFNPEQGDLGTNRFGEYLVDDTAYSLESQRTSVRVLSNKEAEELMGRSVLTLTTDEILSED